MVDTLSYKINYILVAIVSLIALYTDYRYGKIYNWLNFSVLLIGIIMAMYQHHILSSIAGIVIGFVIMFPFFASGGMGAGDIKFAMATGALVGGRFLLFAFMGAGILILLYAFVKKMGVGRLVLKGLKDLLQVIWAWVKNAFVSLKISAITHNVFIPMNEMEKDGENRRKNTFNKIRYGVFLGFSNIVISVYLIIEQGGFK